MEGKPVPAGAASASVTNFFSLGAELLSEVQKIVGTNRVRALRLKLGNRVIKELPIAPLTAVATVALVVLAVLVSSLSIEVEQEPQS